MTEYRPYDSRRDPKCDRCHDTGTVWPENMFGEALAPKQCEDQACRLGRSF